MTHRSYLAAQAPRRSPGRAKDRRSRPEHDRSPQDRDRVASAEVRDDVPVFRPSQPSLGVPSARVQAFGESEPSLTPSERRQSSISTVPCCHRRVLAGSAGRAQARRRRTRGGWELHAAILRRSVASVGIDVIEAVEGTTHVSTQQGAHRLLSKERGIRAASLTSAASVTSRSACSKATSRSLCRDLAGCGARPLRLWH